MPAETGIALPQRSVTSGSHTYMVVSDLICRHRLLIALEIVDASAVGANRRVRARLTARVRKPVGVWARVTRDGFVVIGGNVTRVFPDLAASDHKIEVEVSSAAFRTLDLIINVPNGTTFPMAPAGVVMHPRPITLAGRVVSLAAGNPPIPDALVVSDGLRVVALRTPLNNDHDTGVELHEVTVNTLGPAKTFDTCAQRSTTTIRPSNRQNLAAGNVLRLGGQGRREFARIAQIPAEPADLAQPGDVILARPLVRSFSAGDVIQRVQVADNGGGSTLATPVYSGTAILEVTSDLSPAIVRIESMASADLEVVEVGALSDADGYYKLDGWDRPPSLDLRASANLFDDALTAWRPNFSVRKDVVDVVMKPS